MWLHATTGDLQSLALKVGLHPWPVSCPLQRPPGSFSASAVHRITGTKMRYAFLTLATSQYHVHLMVRAVDFLLAPAHALLLQPSSSGMPLTILSG